MENASFLYRHFWKMSPVGDGLFVCLSDGELRT